MKDQILAGGFRVSALALRLLLTLVLARGLPLDQVGTFFLYLAGVQICSGLAGVDSYASVIRQIIADKLGALGEIQRLLGLVVLSVVVLFPVAVWPVLDSAQLTFLRFAPLFFAHIILEAVVINVSRLMAPLNMPLRSTLITLFASIWILPTGLILEFTDYADSAGDLIQIWFVCSIVTCAFALWSLSRALGRFPHLKFDLKWSRNIILATLPFFIGSLAYRTVVGLDKFFVEATFDLAIVGLYGLFMGLGTGVISLLEAGVSIFRYPKMLEAISARDRALTITRLKRFCLENMIFTLLIVGGAIAVSPILFHIMFGGFSWAYFQLYVTLFVGITVFGLSIPFHYVIFGLKIDYVFAPMYGLAVLVLVSWNALVGDSLGAIGAGLMITLALLTISVARIVVAAYLLRVSNWPKTQTRRE